ncbi:hypothetical protein QG37_07655 [Candidozyma auris]|nr:hypothetical protein QG37_07655 [[Candida] auris]
MNTNCNSHEQVSGSFGNFPIHSKQVGPLQGLEAEVIVVEVSVVDDGRVQLVLVLTDDVISLFGNHGRVQAGLWVDVLPQDLGHSGESLGGSLVQVRHRYSGSQNRIVWVDGRHVGGGLSSQVVQLDGGNSLVDSRDHSSGDGNGIDMLRVQAVAQPSHSGGDFVEAHGLLVAVSLVDVHGGRKRRMIKKSQEKPVGKSRRPEYIVRVCTENFVTNQNKPVGGSQGVSRDTRYEHEYRVRGSNLGYLCHWVEGRKRKVNGFQEKIEDFQDGGLEGEIRKVDLSGFVMGFAFPLY